MPRRRDRQTAPPTDTSTQTATLPTPTDKESKMAAATLSQDQINELLAGARTKGAGDEVMREFLDSGEAGIEVDLTSGPLAGKTAAQAAVSLNAAKNRTNKETGNFVHADARQVQVIKRKIGDAEHVFLVDKSKYNASA